MRDTDPVKKQFTGDTEAAAGNMGVARTQLGQLKNQMAFGNLQFGTRQTVQPDGTVIRTTVAAGIPRIQIDSPAVTQPETPPVDVETPPFHPREVRPPKPPTQYQLAYVNGYVDVPGVEGEIYAASLWPVAISGELITGPDQRGPIVMGNKFTYGFIASGNNLAMLVGVIDVHTGEVASVQPDITGSVDAGGIFHVNYTGGDIVGLTIYTAEELAAIVKSQGGKVKPGQLTEVGLDAAWVDSPCTLYATDPDGTAIKGRFTVVGGAIPGITMQDPLVTITANGIDQPYYAPVGDSCDLAIEFTVSNASFTGPWQFPGNFYILFPGPRDDGGTAQAGVLTDADWSQIAGDVEMLDMVLSAGWLYMTPTISGFGMHTSSGPLILTDSYGNVKTIDFTVTINVISVTG